MSAVKSKNLKAKEEIVTSEVKSFCLSRFESEKEERVAEWLTSRLRIYFVSLVK